MLPEEVKIDIETIGYLDGESTSYQVKATGKCYLKNQKIYISYSEKLEGVDVEIPSLITFDENQIQISRRGEVRSTMKFLSGTDTKCQYTTVAGTIDLVIHTNKYAAILKEDSVKIYLDYSVKMNGTDGGSNSIYILIS